AGGGIDGFDGHRTIVADACAACSRRLLALTGSCEPLARRLSPPPGPPARACPPPALRGAGPPKGMPPGVASIPCHHTERAMTVIAGIPRIERLLRSAAGLEFDRSDLRRHEQFVNRKIHDL